MEEETVDSKKLKKTYFKSRQVKIIESEDALFFYKTLKMQRNDYYRIYKGHSLVIQWLRLLLLQGAQVQSLAGELRSHGAMKRKQFAAAKIWHSQINK